MNLRELARRLNRLQHATPFKIVASIAVVVVAAAVFATYFVSVTSAPESAALVPEFVAPPEMTEAQRSELEAAQRTLREILEGQRVDIKLVGTVCAAGAGVAIIIVWLGLGLTYLGLGLVVAAVAWPLAMFEPTRDWARLLVGVVALTAAFTALMQALRVLLSGPGPVFAVARNVLAEAVRMKISIVFIVLLIVGLAALPDLLNPATPLRYRVQSFLQYGTGGSFWIIAILVLFFSVASVAFEQRDRQIWQTMTKPVAAWQYILGKWLGVVGLAAVLLAVCCSAIFLFTEHLRTQPARGEIQTVGAQSQPTEDRLILETQVLAARVSVEALPPPDLDEEALERAIIDRIEKERRLNPDFPEDSEELRAKMASDLRKGVVQLYRSIEPTRYEIYVFEGLAPARQAGQPLILRYRIDAGSNPPDQLYRLTFIIDGTPIVEEVGLGHSHTLPALRPGVIDDEGRLIVQIYNGDVLQGIANPETITFPPGGLEVSYSAGSYRMNFLRVALVLWIKLAFLAMLAITAATFLSFPVACMVAFGAFFAAESALFLVQSLEVYDTLDRQGNAIWYKVVIAWIATAVSRMFSTYANLKPTTSLVDGRLLAWSSVAWAVVVIGIWSLALYGAAVAIFRRRELATYSGQ